MGLTAINSSMLRVLFLGTFCFIASVAFVGFNGHGYPTKLSEWQIFDGKLSLLKPKPGVVPYTLNTPLYSDYAEKARLVRLPAGMALNYKTRGVLDFPKGTVLVKTFYYSTDFRKPGANKQIIETRLLIKEANEWKAITYVWNDEQTEAFLEIAGDDKQIRFIDKSGVAQ